MHRRTIFLTLAFCVYAAVTAFAADANEGTWKLNEAKSKIPAGASKNTSVAYTAEGDNFKGVVDGVDASGNAVHSEWTGKFDGKDYPVTGDPTADTRAIKKVDDRHYQLVTKKNGKTVATGTIAFSPDGKTRTVTINTTDASGKKITSTAVYDKQ